MPVTGLPRIMDSEITITTVHSGRDYQATVSGTHTYSFTISDGGMYVEINTPARNMGAYDVHLFGGYLSPAGIRRFLTENIRISA